MSPEQERQVIEALVEMKRKLHAQVRVIEILCEGCISVATKSPAHADEILETVRRAKIALQVRT